MEPRPLGYLGENIAAHFLQSKGYRIKKNNFTIRGGEIDLVAEKGNQVIFAEVKTRTNCHFGHGDESLGSLKKRSLRRSIERYLYQNYRTKEPDHRFDVIEIQLDPETNQMTDITHTEDVEL